MAYGPDDFPGSDEESHFLAHETSRLYKSPPEAESLKEWVEEQSVRIDKEAAVKWLKEIEINGSHMTNFLHKPCPLCKPCPFCNNLESYLNVKNMCFSCMFSVICFKCEARGPLKREAHEAISSWNKLSEVIHASSAGSK